MTICINDYLYTEYIDVHIQYLCILHKPVLSSVFVIVSLLNRKEGSPCVVTVTDTTPFLAKHVKEKLGCHTGI